MPINSYFNQTTYTAEQGLIQDLIDESIQIFGHETYYITRDDVDVDTLLGEDELARFTTAYPIEMYIKSSASFQGQSEFVSKFGLVIEDQCTFTVSQRRFTAVANGAISRPREGDIIWLQMTPTNRYLFEIKFVEDKEQLFQLGKLYTYEIRTELMNYSHERVQTSIEEVDNVATDVAYTLDIQLGSGNGAYIVGETVYQGSAFIDAGATGTVSAYDSATHVLSVQNITGAFANDVQIVGVTSGAIWTPSEDIETAPTSHDPIADNETVRNESSSIIIVRGSNPRRT